MLVAAQEKPESNGTRHIPSYPGEELHHALIEQDGENLLSDSNEEVV